MTWNCHLDESAKGGYDMILGKDLLNDLGLNIKLSDCVIESDDGPFKGSVSPIVDLGTYEFKYLNTGKITPEEIFMNYYAEEVNELEQLRPSTIRLRVTLDAKYKKADLYKVLKNQ